MMTSDIDCLRAENEELKLQRRDLRRLDDYRAAELVQCKEGRKLAEEEAKAAKEEARVAKGQVLIAQKACADKEEIAALLKKRENEAESVRVLLRTAVEERSQERMYSAMEKWALEAEIGSREAAEEKANEEIEELNEANAVLVQRIEALNKELESTKEGLQLRGVEVQSVREELKGKDEELQSNKEALQSARDGLRLKGDELRAKETELRAREKGLHLTRQKIEQLEATNLQLQDKLKQKTVSHTRKLKQVAQHKSSLETENTTLSNRLLTVKKEAIEQSLNSPRLKRVLELYDEVDIESSGTNLRKKDIVRVSEAAFGRGFCLIVHAMMDGDIESLRAEIAELKLQRQDLRQLRNYHQAEALKWMEEARVSKEAKERACTEAARVSSLLGHWEDEATRCKEELRVGIEGRKKAEEDVVRIALLLEVSEAAWKAEAAIFQEDIQGFVDREKLGDEQAAQNATRLGKLLEHAKTSQIALQAAKDDLTRSEETVAQLQERLKEERATHASSSQEASNTKADLERRLQTLAAQATAMRTTANNQIAALTEKALTAQTQVAEWRRKYEELENELGARVRALEEAERDGSELLRKRKRPSAGEGSTNDSGVTQRVKKEEVVDAVIPT